MPAKCGGSLENIWQQLIHVVMNISSLALDAKWVLPCNSSMHPNQGFCLPQAC